MARHFDEVVGVDIAPSVITGANALNRFGTRCRYLVNGRPNLQLLGEQRFDLIYTTLVLQHMRPSYTKRGRYCVTRSRLAVS